MNDKMNGKYLVAIGTNCIDEYYELDKVPQLGEKAVCHYLESRAGGMIGNAVSVYASYGMDAYMIDFVNHGRQAAFLLDDLKSYGVNTAFVTSDESRPDAKCMIMLKNGERIIFVVNNQKADLVLNEKQILLLNKAEFVYTTITELLALRDYASLIDSFRAAGAKLVLDMEGNTIKNGEAVFEIIRRGDILFVNDAGVELLQSFHGPGILHKLAEAGALVVLTLGARGCKILQKGNEYPPIPAIDTEIIDTTGAGDTFNASFLYGLSRGWDVMETASFANAAAARSIGILGARSGAAGEAAVRQFISRY
jgi:ribokinase